MGKPTVKQQYKDDPDAVSLHTTPDDYAYDDLAGPSDGLPSYTDSEAAVSIVPHTSVNGDDSMNNPEDSYDVIEAGGGRGWNVIRGPTPIDRGEVTIRMDERLTDPDELYRYVDKYLSNAPPRPTVNITGWHWETVRRKDKKEKERVCDFDISLSFQPYLSRPRTTNFWQSLSATHESNVYRGGWRKTRAAGHQGGIQLTDEPNKNLPQWCEDFCASPARLKVFRVTRLIDGWNTELLKGQIEALVRSTQYRGHLDITFPVEQRYVDIYTPHTVNKWRISWIRYIFYFTFLWLFTWPILFFMTKWWDVYTVVWSFSYTNQDGTRTYATLSEKQWMEKHKKLIKRLVFDRFQGDASSHPTHFAVEPERRQSQTGNENLDSAIGFVQSGMRSWSNFSAGRNPDDQGWGYDA